ncbi:MAG: hypothetical protein IBX57_00615 [Gammaproteobacteria bacterium]|nr:hypothetical protein [Gammaproteobacteria bacterium]
MRPQKADRLVTLFIKRGIPKHLLINSEIHKSAKVLLEKHSPFIFFSGTFFTKETVTIPEAKLILVHLFDKRDKEGFINALSQLSEYRFDRTKSMFIRRYPLFSVTWKEEIPHRVMDFIDSWIDTMTTPSANAK